MPGVFEVEVKFPVGDQLDEVLSRLDEKGAVAVEPVVQADREVSRLVDTRRVMPGVTVSYAQKVTEGTDDLFDDVLYGH